MLFWKINNIQRRRKISHPSVIAQSCFQTLNSDYSMACAPLLSNQLAFYMAMSVSLLQIKKMLPRPTKSRMSEKYKDGLRQS